LEAEHLDDPGLFRVAGFQPVVSELEAALQRGETDLSGLDHARLDPHSVAQFSKRFFRDSFDPLFPLDSYPPLLAAFRERDWHALAAEVRRAPSNPAMARVFVFLARVSERSSINLMTTRNLATVWAPTLLRPRQGADEGEVAYQLRLAGDNAATVGVVQHLLELAAGSEEGETPRGGEPWPPLEPEAEGKA
jgi:hypothetical protein